MFGNFRKVLRIHLWFLLGQNGRELLSVMCGASCVQEVGCCRADTCSRGRGLLLTVLLLAPGVFGLHEQSPARWVYSGINSCGSLQEPLVLGGFSPLRPSEKSLLAEFQVP